MKLPSSAVIPAADEAKPAPPPLAPSRASTVARPRAPSSPDHAPIRPRAPSSPDLPPMRSRAPSSPELPTARRARSTPLPTVLERASEVTTAAPRAPEVARAADAAVRAAEAAAVAGGAPAANAQALPSEVQEQLFGVLRAALDVSIEPLAAKQKELETRLEALRHQKSASAGGTPTVTRAPGASQAAPPKGSVVPTSYGFVLEPEGGVRRPSIEVALEKVGPIDVPNFGGGRRAAGRIVVVLLLAAVAAAIAATILSHT